MRSKKRRRGSRRKSASDTIVAVDPGPSKSGVVAFCASEWRLLSADVCENEDLLGRVDDMRKLSQEIVIEQVTHYGSGMPVGREVFETVYFSGRLAQKWISTGGVVHRISRQAVKVALCGTARAKDPNVRQAIIDRFEPSGGGSVPQIGVKSKPGPLYGVRSHCWSALAVAVAWSENAGYCSRYRT